MTMRVNELVSHERGVTDGAARRSKSRTYPPGYETKRGNGVPSKMTRCMKLCRCQETFYVPVPQKTLLCCPSTAYPSGASHTCWHHSRPLEHAELYGSLQNLDACVRCRTVHSYSCLTDETSRLQDERYEIQDQPPSVVPPPSALCQSKPPQASHGKTHALPTSKPLLAGSDMHAFANSASSLSNTGDPRPEGTFLATHSTTPPMESPVLLILSMRSIMRSAASSSGQRTMFASTCSCQTGWVRRGVLLQEVSCSSGAVDSNTKVNMRFCSCNGDHSSSIRVEAQRRSFGSAACLQRRRAATYFTTDLLSRERLQVHIFGAHVLHRLDVTQHLAPGVQAQQLKIMRVPQDCEIK